MDTAKLQEKVQGQTEVVIVLFVCVGAVEQCDRRDYSKSNINRTCIFPSGCSVHYMHASQCTRYMYTYLVSTVVALLSIHLLNQSFIVYCLQYSKHDTELIMHVPLNETLLNCAIELLHVLQQL